MKNNLASLWILASKKYRSAGEEADVYLLESLKVAEELKDKKLEASIRVNLGNLLVGWGNYEDAVWNYNEAVKHADAAGDNERVPSAESAWPRLPPFMAQWNWPAVCCQG